ncbi:MAG: hypothetical protein FJ291_09085 [Planctomycetes bacterium]|nr:hypothetical protein [Planctomycetota bacterium]
MASKHQFTGMTGVYLVAAELSRRDLVVSSTSRNAQAADLLVTDAECKNTYAVEVKTNRKPSSFWLVNSRTSELVSRNLIYAFVNLRDAGAEFFLVPSAVVARSVNVSKPSKTRKAYWYSVERADIARFRDKWSLFRK